MRTLALMLSLLMSYGVAFAQSGSHSIPYPSANHTPGSQQAGSAASESTIAGCLLGSAVTSNYVLTDKHTREIYVLQGNEPLLKEQVGHEVMLTGMASPVQPSNQKGSIGYISPSQPHRTATSAYAGAKALNFEVTHVQPLAVSCSQQTESEKAAIAASQAALGSTAQNPNATEPKVGYQAGAEPQGNQQISTPPAGPSGPTQPATGKTGNQGEAFPVTTTGSAGHVTPGNETQAGKAQEPGVQTGLGSVSGAASMNGPGAPPTAEQTVQTPTDAERIASSAQRAEINNSQHQLGVNAEPNYNQSAQQESAQANQSVTGPNYEQNRNPQTGTSLPGASQRITSGQHHREQQAEEHQQTHPTLVGCLQSGTGRDSHEFVLKEQASGTRYRLNASREELKDHVNHMVEVVGKPGHREGMSQAMAANNEAIFEVTGIQDLAPTCGASRPR